MKPTTDIEVDVLLLDLASALAREAVLREMLHASLDVTNQVFQARDELERKYYTALSELRGLRGHHPLAAA